VITDLRATPSRASPGTTALNFTTVPEPDTVRPTRIDEPRTTPAVAPDANLVFTFSEPVFARPDTARRAGHIVRDTVLWDDTSGWQT
jgi:hypothetical protein